jgi:hypothetical protein
VWSSGVTFTICNFAKTSLLARFSDEWCAKAESLGDDRVRHRGAYFPSVKRQRRRWRVGCVSRATIPIESAKSQNITVR